LDELDALLQRMLDLPVQQAEEEPEPPVPPAAPSRREPLVRLTIPAFRRIATTPPEPLPPSIPSYMVVETNTPVDLSAPAPPTVEAAEADLGPRILRPEPQPPFEEPVPGGRHDLEADDPVDPAEELARLQAELGRPPEEWVPFQSSWQPSAQTWKPLAETWQQARTVPVPSDETPGGLSSPSQGRPALREMPQATRPSGPVIVTQTAPLPEPPPLAEPVVRPGPMPFTEALVAARSPSPPVALPSAPPRSIALLPLVWFNAAFDLALTPWGPVGEWFKGKGGRGILGTVGLLCLAGAAALAIADGFGWTW
jgi:hypothetical protein